MSFILDFTVRASETVGEDFSFDVIFDEYEIKNKLGEGGFGSVVWAIHKETSKEKAIKFINIHEYMHQANMID